MSSTAVPPRPVGLLSPSSLMESEKPILGNIHQRMTSTPLFFISVMSAVRAALAAATPFLLQALKPPKSVPQFASVSLAHAKFTPYMKRFLPLRVRPEVGTEHESDPPLLPPLAVVPPPEEVPPAPVVPAFPPEPVADPPVEVLPPGPIP